MDHLSPIHTQSELQDIKILLMHLQIPMALEATMNNGW